MESRGESSELASRTVSQLPSWLLAHAALQAQRLTGRRFELLGMRRQHFSVLATLDEHGAVSQAELCRQLWIDRSDMVAVINELEHGGLVRRSRDETDRRRNAVALTPAGIFALRQLDAQVRDAEEELLAPLSAAERARLDRLLRRLVEHHGGQRPPGR
ncbi:MAG TPA: MarR family transcriptional regulator [Solirubrobacteraceae bacterium]|nr:MarR family transcriptional regulator [Solirubrobacteraceae bacterium]